MFAEGLRGWILGVYLGTRILTCNWVRMFTCVEFMVGMCLWDYCAGLGGVLMNVFCVAYAMSWPRAVWLVDG